MRALVTGCAGFIGSHLTEELLSRDHFVVGIDCFTEYYARALKERNLSRPRQSPKFVFHDVGLADANLEPLLTDVDVVYHLAAQPGVRASWGQEFEVYVRHNILATQQLLESLHRSKVSKLVYASSSSIYGNAEHYPTTENTLPQPISPYGVTKLTGEHLCFAYGRDWGLPVVALRYFTVYGPRQRPDMAFHRFINKIRAGEEIDVYGDGRQTRDFTFVGDVVKATADAGFHGVENVALNVGGGSRCELLHVLELLGTIMGRKPKLRFGPSQRGDVRDTGADLTLVRRALNYHPAVSLEEGLRRQVEDMTGE